MYIPDSFRVTEISILQGFLQAYSFATLVTVADTGPFATHLPLLIDQEETSPGVLVGHVARENSHWHLFDGKHKSLAIFQGPHAYISPTWYMKMPAVPTWNYTVVHAYGSPKVIDNQAWLEKLLDRMVKTFESGLPEPWKGDLPSDFKSKLLKQIVGFSMKIDQIEGKFKLGQNRSLEDQLSMIQHLRESSDPTAHSLAELIQVHLGQRSG